MHKNAFLLCTDNNYSAHAGTCIISLLLSTNRRDFDIILLTSGLDKSEILKHSSIQDIFGVNIKILDSSVELKNIKSINPEHSKHRISHVSDATLLRLCYAGLVSADYNFIAYVDCDILFTGDGCTIFDQDLEENTIGAAADLITSISEPNPSKGKQPYFNAGVLLINNKSWREQRIEQSLLNALKSIAPEELRYSDQEILNRHFQKSGYKELSQAFNYQIMATLTNILEPKSVEFSAASILHFAGQIKPWHQWSPKRMSSLYEKYRLISPWGHKYEPQKPSNQSELLVGYQCLAAQGRFQEACLYANTIVRSLTK